MAILQRIVHMQRFLPAVLLLPVLGLQAQPQAVPDTDTIEGEPVVHHSLRVTIDPFTSFIAVEDSIRLPPEMRSGEINFLLNENLQIDDSSVSVRPLGSGSSQTAVGINSTGADTATSQRYAMTVPARAGGRLTLRYQGNIFQPAQQTSAQYSRSFSETSGIIEDQGVYLNGASLWVPNFGRELVTFDLRVQFADSATGWTAVSQGSALGENTWLESSPMEEIYLIAADFSRYTANAGDIETLVYLRQPNPNLAARYLDATERYLALYEPLLGEYPFDKFALIENFWETGYGMPSFTLLGPQIIRFPFIIDSSYPHEILHNWWGNGVYPDYNSGNWSEGLTTYLADHLFQETNGLGHEYRKDNLIRYRNYVADGDDFPLSDFTSRSSAATQAVGYGKTLMLWHMLRREIGDEAFIAGLRELYDRYLFQRAGFDDIAALFSELTWRDLQPFFDQWVDRTGAPRLELSVEDANNNQARIMFTQVQDGEPYALTVPVALFYEGESEARIYHLNLTQKFEGVVAEDFAGLEAVVVDPWFDVFRQLDRAEIPPTIGQLFGAGEISFILPEQDRVHWRQLAEAFSAGVDAQILLAEEIDTLPADRAVWILGRDNPFAASIQAEVAEYGTNFSAQGLTLAGGMVEYGNRSSVITASHPASDDLAIGWIHVDDMVAMPGMIEKLPHYGKYSYLSFVGAEPTNDIKGVWNSPDSPMQWFAESLPAGYQLPEIPPSAPLAVLPPKYLPDQLQRHVLTLSGNEYGGRQTGTPGAAMAANYIADQFEQIGLQAAGESFIHEWQQEVEGRGRVTLRNVIGVIPGSNPDLTSRPAVIGAHFDHLGTESFRVNPGADDNASGISVMLEVAAKLSRSYAPQRPLIFVAFDGEEAGLLGSQHFIDQPPQLYRSADLFAMVNLDSVGRLEGRPLQVFGSDSAYEWPFMAQGIGFTIGVTSVMAQQVIASSDHVPFLNAGIPAIHLFSGTHPDYHRPTDTADKLDYAGLSDIALWLEEAAVFLGGREAPLRVTLANAPVAIQPGTTTSREASLGTVPDFAYGGTGVRISGVTPGGAAAEAGLREGDVLLRYDGQSIADLQTYSNLIRQSAPGDQVQLVINRGGQELEIPVTLQAR